jgi:hypothetical protein
MPVAALPVARRSRAALSGTEDQHVIAEMFDHSATRWLSRPQVRLLFLEGILTMTHGSCGPHANRMGREAVTQRNTHENQSVNSLTNKQGQRSPVTSRSAFSILGRGRRPARLDIATSAGTPLGPKRKWARPITPSHGWLRRGCVPRYHTQTGGGGAARNAERTCCSSVRLQWLDC